MATPRFRGHPLARPPSPEALPNATPPCLLQPHLLFRLLPSQGAGRVIFETEVVETGAAAIKHAYVDLHTDESPPARL